MIKAVKIESRFLPPFEFDFTAPPSPVTPHLKPSITAITSAGHPIKLYEPYGHPGKSLWPLIASMAFGVTFATGWLVGKSL